MDLIQKRLSNQLYWLWIAFYNRRQLSIVDFGKNSILKHVGETAFGNAQKVEEYIFPDTIEIIEKHAFGGNRDLKRVSLPAGEWEFVKKTSTGVVMDSATVTISTPEANLSLFSTYGGYHLIRKI